MSAGVIGLVVMAVFLAIGSVTPSYQVATLLTVTRTDDEARQKGDPAGGMRHDRRRRILR
jgi:hypothetical protein